MDLTGSVLGDNFYWLSLRIATCAKDNKGHLPCFIVGRHGTPKSKWQPSDGKTECGSVERTGRSASDRLVDFSIGGPIVVKGTLSSMAC